ncbi:MAG: radical SAM protein [Candidatus Omnitrophota bacterium]
MRVLFIYTNINGFHDDCYSFGLASIVSVTRINGYEPKVIIVRSKKEYSQILREIDSFQPQVVGFSAVSSQFSFVSEIASFVKQKSKEIITVCGGVHPTINPDCLLETKFLDGIFIGESEKSFVEFLDKIKKNEPYEDTDNYAYMNNGQVIINKLKPLMKDLDDVPYPDKQIYPYEDTIKKTGLAPFLFSRGCPYLCSYCSNHAIAKRYGLPRNTPRYRSPESCIAELEETISSMRIDTIFIMDDIFGIDKKWRMEFCEKYRKRINKPFICLLRVELVDEEFISLLKDAGCYKISVGLESGNEYVRNKIMNRLMSNDRIIKAFKIIKKYKLETNTLNIIGTPGETEEMLWDTIKMNRTIHPTTSGVNIFYPYKGTKLGDSCFDQGLVNEELYNNFSRERRATVLNYSEAWRKKLAYYRDNWEALVYPFDFKRAVKRSLRKTFFWKYLRRIKNFIRIVKG